MKIAVYDSLPAGGAKRSTLAILERLAPAHTLALFSLLPGPSGFCDFEDVIADVRRYEYALTPRFNFPWSRLYSVWQNRDLSRLLDMWKRMGAAIDAEGFDLCYMPSCQFTEIPLGALFMKTPTVYHAASFDFETDLYAGRPYNKRTDSLARRLAPDVGFSLYQKRRKALQKQAMERTTRVLTISRFMHELVFMRYGIQSRVVRRAVDAADFFHENGKPPESLVLSIGSVEPRKGHDLAIRAIAQIPKARRPRLGIAYTAEHPPEREWLNELARQLDVEVEWHAHINSAAAMRQLYNRAQVVCAASVMEALGRVPLEAAACGIPVVAIAEGGLRESVIDGETGILVQRDAGEVAAAIERIRGDGALARQLGENGRAHVLAEWNWDRVMEQMEAELHAAAALGKRGGR